MIYIYISYVISKQIYIEFSYTCAIYNYISLVKPILGETDRGTSWWVSWWGGCWGNCWGSFGVLQEN